MSEDRLIQLLIKAKDESGSVLTGHMKSLDDLTTKYLGLSLKATAAYAAIVTGIALAAKETYKFVDAQAELGDAMDEMSARTDMSVESLSKWSYVLAKDGASIDEFEGATRRLARAMVEAQEGGKEQQAAFARLGVEYQDSNGQLVDLEEMMLRVSDGLHGMSNTAERTATMTQLLGRGAGNLAVVMNQGRDAIQANMQELQRYGGVMTGEFATASAGFEDSQARLAAAWDGLKRSMAEPFMEPFAAATDRAAAAVAGLNRNFERQVALRTTLASLLGSYAPMVLGMGTSTPSTGALPGDAAINYGNIPALPGLSPGARVGPGFWSPPQGAAPDDFELGNLIGPMEDFDAVLKDAATHSVVLKDNLGELGNVGSQSAEMIGNAMYSALGMAINQAEDLNDIFNNLGNALLSVGLTLGLNAIAPGLGTAVGPGLAGIASHAQGGSVRGGIPGMDSVLIRAQHGEEVLDRTLAQDLRSYLAQVRFAPGSAGLAGAASTGGNYAINLNTVFPTRPSEYRRVGREIVRSIREAERGVL